jgi:CheY-like chemotaxis protein
MVQLLHHEERFINRSRVEQDMLSCIAKLKGDTILLVEADPDRQWQITRLLTREGRRVIGTASSAGAVAFLSQFRASLVLIAENLPKAQGRYLASAIRKNDPGLPVIMLGETNKFTPEIDQGALQPLWNIPKSSSLGPFSEVIRPPSAAFSPF